MINDLSPSQEHPRPPKLQQSVIILQVGSWYLQTWQIFINLETYSYCHQRKSWSSETLSKSSDAVRSSSNYFKTLIFISFLMDLRILRMLKNFSFPFCADFFAKFLGKKSFGKLFCWFFLQFFCMIKGCCKHSAGTHHILLIRTKILRLSWKAELCWRLAWGTP